MKVQNAAAKSLKNAKSLNLRKDFIACWTHANPEIAEEAVSSLYDLLVSRWPEVSRGGHRGLVGRVKPWENIVHACPCCGLEAQGLQGIKEGFGVRFYKARGKSYLQSWCRSCRADESLKGKGSNGVRINPEVLGTHFS